MRQSGSNTGEISENRSWVSIHSLLDGNAAAPTAIVGVPMGRDSISPGRCDLAPAAVRTALKRMSVYDLETESDLSALSIFDAGDAAVTQLDYASAFDVAASAIEAQTSHRRLTIVLGGDNAITRPGVHATDRSLRAVGVLTLDAHFDLRDTNGGLNNGNPIQALLEDGLAGSHISQIGLAPFANTRKAHGKARAAGISVRTLSECQARGFTTVVREELSRLAALCSCLYVDFDIDVIDRAQMPAAPGARAGGIAVRDFFAAARLIAAHPKVRCVDLAEFDPSKDVSDIGALTAARWVAEVLAGFSARR
jgi:formiminoglutamase